MQGSAPNTVPDDMSGSGDQNWAKDHDTLAAQRARNSANAPRAAADLRISEIKDALRIEGGSLSSAESSIRALGTVLQVHSEPQEEDG